MWVESRLNDDIQQNFLVEAALCEEKERRFFLHAALGKVVIHNQRVEICEHESITRAEMMVHAPLCVFPKVPKVLILEDAYGVVTREALRHNASIDIVMEEGPSDCARQHFSNTTTALEDPRATLRYGDPVAAIMAAQDESYDIVLLNIKTDDDAALFEHIRRILSPEGICIVSSGDLELQQGEVLHRLQTMAPFFRYLLPYRTGTRFLPDNGLIFASKKLHPTADIRLQQADMLEGLSYYTADVHESAFALPAALFQTFRNALKY